MGNTRPDQNAGCPSIQDEIGPSFLADTGLLDAIFWNESCTQRMWVHRASCVVVVAILLSGVDFAPVRAQLAADRPGFANRAVTVNEGTVHVEGGYSYRDIVRSTHQLGPALVRAGLTDRLELRAGLGKYVVAETQSGYAGAGVGAKFRLLHAGAAAIAAISSTTIPISSLPGAPGRVRQKLTVAFDAALSERLTLSVNSGGHFFYAAGAESDRIPEGIFLSAVGGQLTKQVSGYVGYAGFYGKEQNRSWLETGISVLATPDVQWDLNSGLRVDDNVDFGGFVGMGFAYRF